MSRKPIMPWSDRLFDFVCGFLFGIVLYVIGEAKGRGYSASVGGMLLLCLLSGTIAAVFGRRFWQWWSFKKRLP